MFVWHYLDETGVELGTSVPFPDQASADGKRVEENVKRGITEDFIGQYVQQLQKDLGATINLNVVRQVSSGGSADPDQN